MSEELIFLPWLRRGLAQGLSNVDNLSGSLSKKGVVTARLQLNEEEIEKQIYLRGVDQVIGLDASRVIRTEPKPDSADFEPNYFPLVEFDIADLPWMFTPAAPDEQGRLRPWLVLVTLKVQDGVTLTSLPKSTLSALTISSPAILSNELPDLAESWAWAHAQSSVSLKKVASAVEEDTGEVISRLVCPRNLDANTAYLVCLVPAFDQGVKAGLGEPLPESDNLLPAWEHQNDAIVVDGQTVTSIRLPVFYSWRFETGKQGDFESLCRKLQPDNDAKRLGLYPMDVSDPGIIRQWPNPVYTDFKGVMQLTDLESTQWNRQHQSRFKTKLTSILNAGADRFNRDLDKIDENYNPQKDDPVVAPPLYGSFQCDRFEVPERGWLKQINLSPPMRAAAGLGAKVIRNNQEALMAAAWEQVGELKQTNAELNRARFNVEVGRSLNRRLGDLNDGELTQITKPLHAFVSMEEGTIESNLRSSDVPNGLVTLSTQRRLRPGHAIFKHWHKALANSSENKSPTGLATSRFLLATDPESTSSIKSVIDYAYIGLAQDTQTFDRTLTLEEDGQAKPVQEFELNEVQQDQFINVGLQSQILQNLDTPKERIFSDLVDFGGILVKGARRIPKDQPIRSTKRSARIPERKGPVKDGLPTGQFPQTDIPTPAVKKTPVNVSGSANVLRAELDPLNSIRQNVITRIPLLDGVIPENYLPSKIYVGPIFEQSMYPDLLKIGAQFVCPGIDELKSNRVRALETNSDFVASFLIGCNYEMGNEFLWREYPADLGAVYFHRFWNYIDPAQNDLNSSPWDAEAKFGSILARGNVNDTVVVIRGQLVRRYPNTHYYVQKAQFTGTGNETEPVDGDIIEPSFVGKLSADTIFFGFELDPDVVRGDRHNGDPGYYFGIEQLATEPRFGLDKAKRGDINGAPNTWLDLSWGHLAKDRDELRSIQYASTNPLPGLTDQTIDGTTWAYNASHMAHICFQKPFRMLMHADTLI